MILLHIAYKCLDYPNLGWSHSVKVENAIPAESEGIPAFNPFKPNEPLLIHKVCQARKTKYDDSWGCEIWTQQVLITRPWDHFWAPLDQLHLTTFCSQGGVKSRSFRD